MFRKRITHVLIFIVLATPFISASSLFAQASKPRVNNERPTKVTGQVKRIHPHALKLILQGKQAEAIAYLEMSAVAKVNPDHTKLLLDIARGKPGAGKFDAATWPWKRALPDTSLKKEAPSDQFTIAFGGGAGYVPENEHMLRELSSLALAL